MLNLDLLSKIMNLDWNFRGADLIAIGLGIIAISIAIAIFIVQNKSAKKIDELTKDAISISLGRISVSLDVIRESVDSSIGIVNIKSANDEEGQRRVEIVNMMMKSEKKFYLQAIENMTKEADFLKGKIDSLIHTEIESVINLVKKFSANESLSTRFGNFEALRIWNEKGQEIMQKADDLIKNLEERINKIK